MQQVTDGWPAWPTTISSYTTEQERLISMQMPYWGCHGWGACLKTQVLTSRSQLLQCGLCRKLPSKAPQAPQAYSCDLHILDSVQDSQQVACMTMEDWCQAQQADPTLSLFITRLWEGTLGQWQSKQTDPPELNQFLHEWNHLLLWKGVLYRRARPREPWADPLSAGFLQLQTERSL